MLTAAPCRHEGAREAARERSISTTDDWRIHTDLLRVLIPMSAIDMSVNASVFFYCYSKDDVILDGPSAIRLPYWDYYLSPVCSKLSHTADTWSSIVRCQVSDTAKQTQRRGMCPHTYERVLHFLFYLYWLIVSLYLMRMLPR